MRNSEIRAIKRGKGDIKSLAYIVEYLKPYWPAAVGAVIALLFTSGSVLGMGYGLRYLVDEGISKRNLDFLDNAFFILLGISLLLAIATYARYFLVTWVGERVVADIRNDVYRRLVHMDISYFETTRTGELLSRLTTDTTLLQTVVGGSISVALRNLIMFVGGCVLLMVTSLKLSLYVFMIVPLVVVPIVVLGRKVRSLSRETQDKIADVSIHAEETISSIRAIQVLSLESYECSRFASYVKRALDAAIARIKLRSMLVAIVILLVFGAVSAVLWIGGRDVILGNISSGELSSFVFYAMLVAASAGAISEIVGDLQRAAGATERLIELRELVPKIGVAGLKEEEIRHLPSKLQGNIEFKNVSFSYPSRPNIKASDGLSFRIEAGERVALVGASGAGKSTIFHLLLRCYDPQTGVITIDDVPLNRVDPMELRSHIGLVPQDAVIFSTTAYENIRCGKIDASEEEILEAARKAEAFEFIQELPDGFNSFLGEKGVRLSGGQKQRIAIARAIVRNPNILLLDEATSALDSENEHKVQKALDGLMQNRTTLVIAHRLSTVQNADRILVIDRGKVIASGTHTELLQNSELYAGLAKKSMVI